MLGLRRLLNHVGAGDLPEQVRYICHRSPSDARTPFGVAGSLLKGSEGQTLSTSADCTDKEA